MGLNKRPLWTRNFIFVCFANFFIFNSFHMLVSTFPMYIANMGGDEVVIGFAVAMFSISALIVRPLAGKSLDLMGSRKVLMIGFGIMIISVVSYFWMVSIALIFIFRFLHGIGWGIVTTSFGTIASDIVPPERRGEGLGTYGLSNNLSMSLGPVVGIWLMDGPGFDFLFLLCIILVLLSLLFSRTIRLKPPTAPTPLKDLNMSFFTTGLIEKSAFLPALLMTFMSFLFGGVISFITLFGIESGIENVGLFFVTTAVILMITRPFSGKLNDRKGHPWVIIPGAIFMGTGLMILSYSTSVASLIVAAVFFGIGYGMEHTALHAWTVNLIPAHRRGAAIGTFYSAIDLGVGSGAITLGVVAKLTSYAMMYRLSVFLVLIFLAIYLIELRKVRISQMFGPKSFHGGKRKRNTPNPSKEA